MRNLLLVTLVTTAIGTTSAFAESFPFSWKSYDVMENNAVSTVGFGLSAETTSPSFDAHLPKSIALNAVQVQQIFSERDKYLTKGKAAAYFTSPYMGMDHVAWDSHTQLDSNPQNAVGYEALTVALNAAQVQQILSERDKYLVK